MSKRTHCDGCGTGLSLRKGGAPEDDDNFPVRYVHGEHMSGSDVRELPEPGGEFDWCGPCAVVAFAAVRDANAGRRRA